MPEPPDPNRKNAASASPLGTRRVPDQPLRLEADRRQRALREERKVQRRRRLSQVTAASFALFILTCAFWAWSYQRITMFGYVPKSSRGQLVDGLAVNLLPGPGALYSALSPNYLSFLISWNYGFNHHSTNAGGVWEGVGFEFALIRGFDIAVPYMALAVLWAILPVTYLWKKSRHRPSRNDGICEKCGYDLRCTPKRCPECGAIAPKSSN